MIAIFAIYQYCTSNRKLLYPAYRNAEVDTINTHGLVPGDPKNGIRVLQHFWILRNKYIYITGDMHTTIRKITEYSNNHDHLIRLGFSSEKDFMKYLSNPDNIYSDDDIARKHPDAIFTYMPNQLWCEKPESGKRNVVACIDTYIHKNIHFLGHEQNTLNPVGFYQVLWDDGQIEAISYDKVVYFGGPPRFTEGFRGQCGVPDDAISYDEWYTKYAGFKVAPHGKPGDSGQDPSGVRR